MSFMNLVRFEIIKCVRSRFFLISSLVLGIVIMLLSIYNIRYFGTGRQQFLIRSGVIGAFLDMDEETMTEYENRVMDKYGEEAFSNPDTAMLNEDGILKLKRGKYTASMFEEVIYHNELKELPSPDAVCERILENAKKQGWEAVHAGNMYEIRRNIRIIQKYGVPRKGYLSYVSVPEISDFLYERVAVLLPLFLILYISGAAFSKEEEDCMLLLIKTSVRGKKFLFFAKYVAGITVTVLIMIAFQMLAFFVRYIDVGMSGFTSAVQYIPEFMTCPYDLTVFGYMFVMVAMQTFAAVILSVISVSVSAIFRTSSVSYIISGIIAAGSVVLTFLHPKTEILAGPLALMRTDFYLQGYLTADIFGFPVEWFFIHMTLWVLICMFLMLLAYRRHCQERKKL